MTPEERRKNLDRLLWKDRALKIGGLVCLFAAFAFVVPWLSKFEKIGFARAEVISAKMTESNSGPSSLTFLVRVQDGTLYQANTRVFALRASAGDFVCIELRKRGWTSVLRAVVVVEKHCAGLPPSELAN